MILCPVRSCGLESGEVAARGAAGNLAALGGTSSKSLGSRTKTWSDCHSPSDCHSLIMSGQRGWKYSLSLYNFAAAVVAGGAED